MQTISASRNTKFRISISHVDNDLVVFWNGYKVYEKTDVPYDPVLSEDISLEVLEGRNVLVMVGGNDDGPGHFAGRIDIQGNDPLEFDTRPSGAGIVWSTSLQIQGT